MIKFVFFLVFMLAMLGLTWMAHALVNAGRYDLEHRYLHCRYLAGYLIFLLLAFNRYTFSYILLGTSKLINLPVLQSVWTTILPMQHLKLVYMVLSFLFTDFLLVFVSAILFGLIHLIFGRRTDFVDVRDQDSFFVLRHFPWILAGKFYTTETDEGSDEDDVHVTSRGFTMSLWFGRMKYAFLILMILELAILTVVIFQSDDDLADLFMNFTYGWYLLPMAGYLFVEQLQFFLEGGMEYDGGSFATEDSEDHLEGNLRLMMQVYEEEFLDRDALINFGGWENYRLLSDGLAHNSLTNVQIKDCEQAEILSFITNQLRETGIDQNSSYQNALAELLNGNSVNIRDYIEGEVMIYLAAYMNFFLSQERTFLILCSSEERAASLKESFQQAMNRLNDIYCIWKVSDAKDADSNERMGILVCSYQDIVDHRLVDKRGEFFASLQTIIMTDGTEFCAQGNARKDLIFAEIRKIPQSLQYVLISRTDNDNLRNAFEYYTGAELIPFHHDPVPQDVYFMVWKEESACRMQKSLRIGEKIISPYMGVSLPLALVALKYDFPRVQMLAKSGKGYYTYRDILKMSSQQVSEYLLSEVDLDRRIRLNEFHPEDRQDLEIQILYDSEFNFYNTVIAWMKYGGTKKTLIHVVAPPYMLREYLADQLNNGIKSNNEFDALMSYQSGLDHSRYMALLLELCNAGISEEDLMTKNSEYKWGKRNVAEVLETCLKGILGNAEFGNIYECFHFAETVVFDSEESQYVTKTMVTLTDENIRRRIQSRLAFARMRTKNNLDTELSMPAVDLHNYYQREQIVPIAGYMYRINRIADGTIFAEQTNVTEKLDYYRSTEVEFSNFVKVDECLDYDILDFNLCTADVTVSYYGYWMSDKGINLVKADAMKFQAASEVEKVKKDSVRVLQMRLKKDALGNDPEAAGLLAQFMFQEIVKTLFPYNYMNMYVAGEYAAEAGYWGYIMNENSFTTIEEKLHSLMPFVRTEETDAHYITLYFIEFVSLEVGMVSSLYTNRKKVIGMLHEYLDWYLENTGHNIEDDYVEDEDTDPEDEDAEDTDEDEDQNKTSKDEGSEDKDTDAEDQDTDAEDKDRTSETDKDKSTGDKAADDDRLIIEIDDDDEYADHPADGNEGDQPGGNRGKNGVLPTYLNLGGNSIPNCFAAEALENYLWRIVDSHDKGLMKVMPKVKMEDLSGNCSFCGALAMFTYRMKDGRRMCRGCKEQQIDQKAEITELYRQTVDLLENGYHIKLRKNIHLKMRSATSIRIECSRGQNTPLTGRVLGFYRPAKHEMWIEARGPRNAVQDTMIHELSHSWQFDHMNVARLQQKNPKLALILLEGHTSYMEVDAMRRLGEENYANYLHNALMARTDEYGVGYQLLRGYIHKKSQEGSHWTPYESVKYLFDNLDELQQLLDDFTKNGGTEE